MRAFFTGIDNREIHKNLKNDPFLFYGPGLYNYLKMILRLIIVFTVLSALACMQIILFTS